ncbi:hypothetical protein [Candidatus Flexifilum breve]|uniref:hypothetical protein n=1 Tax=Candidatus Flexifilum breve TaxID=3140694 RepID=UPI0031CCB495
MTPQLTQRQASLAMMVASSALLALMLAYTLFRSDFPLPADLLKLSTVSVTGLTVLYWRRLEFIRPVFIVASTLFIGVALPPEMVVRPIAQAVLFPPIIALVLGGIRSIIGSTIMVWVILLLRVDVQGMLAPDGILVNALCVTGLVVGRLIMDTARRSAEQQPPKSASVRSATGPSRSSSPTTLLATPSTNRAIFSESGRPGRHCKR